MGFTVKCYGPYILTVKYNIKSAFLMLAVIYEIIVKCSNIS